MLKAGRDRSGYFLNVHHLNAVLVYCYCFRVNLFSFNLNSRFWQRLKKYLLGLNNSVVVVAGNCLRRELRETGNENMVGLTADMMNLESVINYRHSTGNGISST